MKKIDLILLGLLCFPTLGLSKEEKVAVELPFTSNGEENERPLRYVDFRPSWGTRLTFATTRTKPSVEGLKQEGTPLQVELSFVRNLTALSYGFEVGYNKSDWNNEIEMSSFHFGFVAHLDNLFSQPYVVPFVSLGGVSIRAQKPDLDPDTGSLVPDAEIETEDIVLYYRFGFLFSLNWIDGGSSKSAFYEYGLMNTYLYFGMRQISETNSDVNLDLSTKLSPEFGLQLEF